MIKQKNENKAKETISALEKMLQETIPLDYYKKLIEDIQEQKPYVFKIYSIYELAIRNPQNLTLINNIIDKYKNYSDAIEHFMYMTKKVSIHYGELHEEDKFYFEGNDAYSYILSTLRELTIFPIQVYDEKLKVIYSRKHIFDDVIFNIITEIAPFMEHQDKMHDATETTIFDIDSNYVKKSVFDSTHTLKYIKYKNDDYYEAEENYFNLKYRSTTLPIVVNSGKEKIVNVYYIHDSIFLEFIYSVYKYNTYYTEIIECFHGSDVTMTDKLYKDFCAAGKTYEDVLNILKTKGLVTIVKNSTFDFIDYKLPFLSDTKHKNIMMNKSYMLYGLENDIFTDYKLNTLHFVKSVLLDEAESVEVRLADFNVIKNSIKNKNQFSIYIIGYDCVNIVKKNLGLTKKPSGCDEAIFNFISREFKLPLPPAVKSFENTQKKFENGIIGKYYKHF